MERVSHTQCEKNKEERGEKREISHSCLFRKGRRIKPGPIKFSASTQLFVIRKIYFFVYSCIFLYIRMYYISQNEIRKIWKIWGRDSKNITSEEFKCLWTRTNARGEFVWIFIFTNFCRSQAYITWNKTTVIFEKKTNVRLYVKRGHYFFFFRTHIMHI